ncbi:helix-turn-helix domain-containing protein [Pseudonocardia eucalypti]|uniref:Helix-turn-helix domain-containing protein n=1 Tax=Pseudonocardia eucalypti TaxID=648755 RepID=A0ABP9PSB6_9PSEU|nr:transcriptional regulator GlxA family with amidase domain [Pseudonocardia eucalypti]
MTVVAVAVTEGIPLFEVAVPSAVFGIPRPDLVDPWYEFIACAPPGATVGGWLRADTPHGLADLARADTVIVPACHDTGTEPPQELLDALRQAYRNGARVASICTGAFVLAAAGLLDGRRATTHWMHAAELAARYPRVRVDDKVLYLDQDNILTSAGKAAGIDLCLHMVRADHGAAVANAVARRMVVAPHREGGQAQFIAAPMPSGEDDRLAELLDWAAQHLDQPITVTDLATRAHLSTRHLTRRFLEVTGTTPLRWLLTQRIHRARELLERTEDGVELVAARVGMGTGATLRRHFNRAVGVPPDAYRRTFHGAAR